MCLSNGNFAGLGKIREKELEKSCEVFDIEPPTTIDVPELQDGSQWKTEHIIEQLKLYLKGKKFDMLVTFDEHGVSSHPNHISVSNAC